MNGEGDLSFSFASLRIKSIFRAQKSIQRKFATIMIRIIQKRLFIHILALCISFCVMFMQSYINRTCFMFPICECEPEFWIRLYTVVKDMSVNYILFMILGANYLKMVSAYKNKKLVIYFFYFSGIFIGTISYMLEDKTKNRSPFLYIYGINMMLFGGLAFWRFYKGNFRCQIFKGELLWQTLYFVVLFLHVYCTENVADILFQVLRTERNGILIYNSIIFLYLYFFAKIIMFITLKIHLLAQEAGFENQKVLVIPFRLNLAYIISLQLSNLLVEDLNNMPITYLISHFHFLVCLYCEFDPIIEIGKLILFKITSNPIFIKESDLKTIKFSRTLGAYMFDFQFIVFSRLLIIYFYKTWLHSGFTDFYLNCKFEINNKYVINGITLFTFFLLMGFTSLVFFLVLYAKRTSLHLFEFQGLGIIADAYVIFCSHIFFEANLMNFRRIQLVH